jgi:hypothetical protein
MGSNFDYFFSAISTMSTIRVLQKAQTVLWHGKFESILRVQCEFRHEYGARSPDDKSITRTWYEQSGRTGSVSNGDVDRVRQAFVRSPKQSISRSSVVLQMRQTTVHRILRKSLPLKTYKLLAFQKLTARDKQVRSQFATHMREQILVHDNFLSCIVFTDDAKLHVFGRINQHNCATLVSKPPRENF